MTRKALPALFATVLLTALSACGELAGARTRESPTAAPRGTLYLAGRSLAVEVASGQVSSFPIAGGSLHPAKNGEKLLVRCDNRLAVPSCTFLIVGPDDRVVKEIATDLYGGGSLSDPILSSDGSLIAFANWADTLVIRRDGSVVGRIPRTRPSEWTANGALLLTGAVATNPGIYIVDALTGNGARISPRAATAAAMSPDAKRIAFEENERVYLLDESGQVTELTAPHYLATDPAWSPDGKWLAVLSLTPQRSLLAEFDNKAVFIISPEKPRQLLDQPLLQPNGRYVATSGRITWR
jgi:hypothetical protein